MPTKGKYCSEEAKEKNRQSRLGKKHSEETKHKIGKANKGRIPWSKGIMKESHPMYGKHHSDEAKRRISEARSGKVLTEETRKKISLSLAGENSPFYGKPFSAEHKRKLSESHIGKIPSHFIGDKNPMKSPELRRRQSERMKERAGKKNSNWKGGISFFPYPQIFNDKLKKSIRDRDNNKCQNPFCCYVTETLATHHIDYNKENCSQFNLITLCNQCNSKANRNRKEWEGLYRKIVWSKYI